MMHLVAETAHTNSRMRNSRLIFAAAIKGTHSRSSGEGRVLYAEGKTRVAEPRYLRRKVAAIRAE